MGVSMVRISHKNCGLTVVVMIRMGRSRRMKTGAKHREQNQELENNTPHRVRLAEQYSCSNDIICSAPGQERAEALPVWAWTGMR